MSSRHVRRHSSACAGIVVLRSPPIPFPDLKQSSVPFEIENSCNCGYSLTGIRIARIAQKECTLSLLSITTNSSVCFYYTLDILVSSDFQNRKTAIDTFNKVQSRNSLSLSLASSIFEISLARPRAVPLSQLSPSRERIKIGVARKLGARGARERRDDIFAARLSLPIFARRRFIFRADFFSTD